MRGIRRSSMRPRSCGGHAQSKMPGRRFWSVAAAGAKRCWKCPACGWPACSLSRLPHSCFWSRLVALEELAYLERLYAQWQPRLRSTVRPVKSASELVRPLSELARSFARFNGRWLAFVEELDLAPLNKLREDYNRYYLLEKECALWSPRIARIGFVPKKPATLEDMLDELPLLKVPALAQADLS